MYLATGVGVIRSDGISGTNSLAFPLGGGFRSVAVDRQRSSFFSASDTQIAKSNLDGTIVTNPFLTAFDLFTDVSVSWYNIQGLAVDEAGYLYAAQSAGISKIDPITGSVVAQFALPNYVPGNDGISDVQIWNNTVLALNHNATAGQAIIYRLNLELSTIIESYGRTTTPADANQPGEFFGPLRFLATLNRKITVAERNGLNARLVSLDDLSGSNWQTYGTYGNGGSSGTPGEYLFYTYSFGS